MADGALGEKELLSLQKWLDNNAFLAGTYPFDELYSLLQAVMADGVITTDEQNQLLAFFSNLIEFKDSFNLVEKDYTDLRKQYSVDGICASQPSIEVPEKVFCFTGEFYRGSRKELEAKVTSLSGTVRSGVTSKTDYLVVGNAGNPCWAYACYGRKIENAVQLRKTGAKVIIVNETDFWDAIDDIEAGISAE